MWIEWYESGSRGYWRLISKCSQCLCVFVSVAWYATGKFRIEPHRRDLASLYLYLSVCLLLVHWSSPELGEATVRYKIGHQNKIKEPFCFSVLLPAARDQGEHQLTSDVFTEKLNTLFLRYFFSPPTKDTQTKQLRSSSIFSSIYQYFFLCS